MRKFIRDFAGLCAKNLPVQDPVYEFGSFQVEGQEAIADLRIFFPGLKYVGSDMRPGPGVDTLLNLHQLELQDGSVGTALLMDTLEHVEYPHLAMQEVFRVLKPGGVAILSSVMNFPIHDYPYDYWRFTPAAFESLLKEFKTSRVEFVGDEKFPHTVVGFGIKGDFSVPEAFITDLHTWKEDSNKKTFRQILRLFTPPILINIYDAITQKQ